MKKSLYIEGQNRLEGKVDISGSKNAALPCLAASLLTEQTVILNNIPLIKDIDLMINIMDGLGVQVDFNRNKKSIRINARNIDPEIPSDLSELIRGSTLFMGSLISRVGRFRIYNYGGCPIGQRPINYHLKVFKLLGADVVIKEKYIECQAEKLKGTNILLDFPSVGATENALIASCFSIGKSILRNVAVEPEIINLIDMLRKMGCKIEVNHRKREIIIFGKKKLAGTNHAIIPDRIEAGTYLTAAAMTNSEISIKKIRTDHIQNIISPLTKMGFIIDQIKDDELHTLQSKNEFKPLEISTGIYPNFPTDMQPQIVALGSQIQGISKVTETIFEDRFHHIKELVKMGAKIQIDRNIITIKGRSILRGRVVTARDIRGGASLVLAALIAKGITQINNSDQIYRGYEAIDKKLKKLGVKIELIEYDD